MKRQENEKEKRNKQISIWIICAVIAAGLTACGFFSAKTTAFGEGGTGASEEALVSAETTAQGVLTEEAEPHEESSLKPDDGQTEAPSQAASLQESKSPQSSEEGQTGTSAQNWGELKIETEVHYLLDSEAVLDEEHLLKKEFCNEFETAKKAKTYGVVYFDGEDRVFEKKGWINRIRMQEGKAEKGFELTYKKRYRISGTDVDSAVRRAAEDGFDLAGGEWEAEVEWGFTSMTLSVSLNKDVPAGGKKGVSELTPEEALSMVEQNMPAEERDWGTGQWGSSSLESAQMVGPVYFTRYKGKFKDSTVQIEIWEIPVRGSGDTRCITEISIKSEDCESAAGIREELKEKLEELGILMEEDSLKTHQVLDAFLGVM